MAFEELELIEEEELSPYEIEFDKYASDAALETGLDYSLIKGLGEHESAGTFKPDIRPPADPKTGKRPSSAVGPMQIIKGTAKELDIDPTDLQQNVMGGARYLRQMIDRYDGDVERGLAAYFKGPAVVDQYPNISDIPGTTGGTTARKYVDSILKRRDSFEAKLPSIENLTLEDEDLELIEEAEFGGRVPGVPMAGEETVPLEPVKTKVTPSEFQSSVEAGEDPETMEIPQPEAQPTAFGEGFKDVGRFVAQSFKAMAETGQIRKDRQFEADLNELESLEDEYSKTPNEDLAKKLEIQRNKLRLSAPGLEANKKLSEAIVKGAERVTAKLAPDKDFKRMPGVLGMTQDFARLGAQVATQTGITAVAGPAAGMGFMMSQIGGGKYEQLRAEGIDAERAFQASLADAALQAPLERIGLSKALKAGRPTKEAKKVIKEIVGAGATEFFTELLQAYPGAITEIWAKTEGQSNWKRAGQFVKDFWETTKQGAYEGFLASFMGGGTAAMGAAQNLELIEEEEIGEPAEIRSEDQEIPAQEAGEAAQGEVTQSETPQEVTEFKEEEEATEIKAVLTNQFIREGVEEAEATKNAEEMFSKATEAEKSVIKGVAIKANHDPLTGLLNRAGLEAKGFMKVRPGEKEAKLVETPMMVVDLDKFKKINDTYGHSAGDEVLSTFGLLLQENSGGHGTVARLGGEEFVIIKNTGASENDILKASESARKEFSNYVFDFDGKKVSGLNFSAGYGQNFDEADAEAYLAKNSGRAQTRVGGQRYGKTEVRRAAQSGEKVRPGDISKGVDPEKAKPEETIGLSNAETAALREAMGKERQAPVETKGFLESAAKAKEQNIPQNAVVIAQDILATRRQASDEEIAGLTLAAADLKKQTQNLSNQIGKTSGEAQAELRRRRALVDDQLFQILDASERTGTPTARALSIRRMLVKLEDFSIVGVKRKAKEAKGSDLTAKEEAKYEKLAVDYQNLQKDYQEMEGKWHQEQIEKEKLLADALTRVLTRKARKTKTKLEKIKEERVGIEKDLKALGYRLNEVTGMSAEGAYLVGRWATNYIQEQALSVKGDIDIKNVVKAVKKKVPELEDYDVYSALNAKNPKIQVKARSEAQKQVSRLKSQARLMKEIEDAGKGIFKKSPKKPPRPAEIKALQKKLTEMRKMAFESGSERLQNTLERITWLQDQLQNHHRQLKKTKMADSPEIQEAQKQIKELRRAMKIEDEIADIDEQLRTGDFKIKAPQKRVIPKNLERQEIALSKKRTEVREAIRKAEPLTAKVVFEEITGLPRTLKGTADFSAWLRQVAVQTLAHPFKSAKLLPSTTKAFFSEYQADKIQNEIENASNNYLYHKHKLAIRELDGPMTKREEIFSSKLADKVPGLGWVIRASNRNMVSVGNLMRTTMFDSFLKRNPNATSEELGAMADWLNVTTGIGNLKHFAAIAKYANLVIWAPKLAVSRVQTPYMMAFKYKNLPRVRKQMAKDFVGYVAYNGALLALAALAFDDDDDVEVGSDPRKADWGKIRVGNTRIDIWGGHQQPARLLARLAISATDRAGISGKDLPESEKDVDPVELMWRFTSYKMSPWIQTTRELITGKTAVGEPIAPTMALAKTGIPLIFEDARDAWRDAGFTRAAWSAGLAAFGEGVNTYGHAYERVLKAQGRVTRLQNEAKKAKGKEKITKSKAAVKWKKENRKLLIHAEDAKDIKAEIKELEEKKEGLKGKAARNIDKIIYRKIIGFEKRFK